MPNYFHTGVPLPTLQWYKDAISISKLQNPRYKMLSSGGLRIQKLRPEDSGIFQCFASNEGGEIQTYTYLDVTSEYCPSAKPDHPGRALRPELPGLCVYDMLRKWQHLLSQWTGCRGQRRPSVKSHSSGQ